MKKKRHGLLDGLDCDYCQQRRGEIRLLEERIFFHHYESNLTINNLVKIGRYLPVVLLFIWCVGLILWRYVINR